MFFFSLQGGILVHIDVFDYDSASDDDLIDRFEIKLEIPADNKKKRKCIYW